MNNFDVAEIPVIELSGNNSKLVSRSLKFFRLIFDDFVDLDHIAQLQPIALCFVKLLLNVVFQDYHLPQE